MSGGRKTPRRPRVRQKSLRSFLCCTKAREGEKVSMMMVMVLSSLLGCFGVCGCMSLVGVKWEGELRERDSRVRLE